MQPNTSHPLVLGFAVRRFQQRSQAFHGSLRHRLTYTHWAPPPLPAQSTPVLSKWRIGISYTVATRKQEIGVRTGLGATRQRIYALTMSETTIPVLAG
jgi:hypothetical protein